MHINIHTPCICTGAAGLHSANVRGLLGRAEQEGCWPSWQPKKDLGWTVCTICRDGYAPDRVELSKGRCSSVSEDRDALATARDHCEGVLGAGDDCVFVVVHDHLCMYKYMCIYTWPLRRGAWSRWWLCVCFCVHTYLHPDILQMIYFVYMHMYMHIHMTLCVKFVCRASTSRATDTALSSPWVSIKICICMYVNVCMRLCMFLCASQHPRLRISHFPHSKFTNPTWRLSCVTWWMRESYIHTYIHTYILTYIQYESNVAFVMRYMVDAGIVGANWVSLPKGSYLTR